MQTKEYFQDFFDNAPIGFHAFAPDQIIIDVNQAELELFGYKKSEIIGRKKWSDLIIENQEEQFERHWEEINTVGYVRNLEYTVVCQDGSLKHVLLNASARFDGKGKLINTRGSILDITERKKVEEKLKQARQKLLGQKKILENNCASLGKLLTEIEAEKESIKGNLEANLEQMIFPLIHILKRRSGTAQEESFKLLEENLGQLTDGFGLTISQQKWKLSTREIDVCHLIRNGLNTREIADLLCTSVRTIEHHRNHIRKKFGISKADVDLTHYLKTLK